MAIEFWIGRSGALRQFPRNPGLGMPRSVDLGARAHRLVAGGQRVDRPIHAARVWEMTFPYLTTETWEEYYSFATGQYGPGPYWLVDPTMLNLLSPDQASGGTAVGDLTSWSAPGTGESLALSTVLVDGGTTSLLWTLPTSPTGGALRLPHRSGLYRASAVGWEWSWWADVQISASSPDATVSLRVELDWRDAAGALLSTTSGAYTPVTTGAWSRLPVTGTAPANAVGFEPVLRVDTLTVTGGAAIGVGRAQLTRGADDAVWHPGMDYPRVSILDQATKLPKHDRYDMSWTLAEVI